MKKWHVLPFPLSLSLITYIHTRACLERQTAAVTQFNNKQKLYDGSLLLLELVFDALDLASNQREGKCNMPH